MLKQPSNRLKHSKPLAALLLGVLAAAGFAPLFWWPVTVVCLGLFFFHVLRTPQSHKKAFLVQAFAFYFGFSVAALWWVGSSFRFTDIGDMSLIAGPFAVAGVAAGLTFYMLPALYIAWRLWPRTHDYAKPLVVAGLWVLVEGLRSLTVFGFPWHLVGYTLAGDDYILQAASVGGVWLLSFLVILPAAAYAARPKVGFTLFWLIPMLAAFSYGALRTTELTTLTSQSTPLKTFLVQPNTAQGQKWQISGILTARRVLDTLTELNAPDTLVVFPEVAVTLLLNNIPNFPQMVGDLLEEGSVAVIGIPREKEDIYLNSMVVINHEGQQIGVFDKQLLVPFGEYVPLRDYLPSFIKQMAQGGDYRGGSGPRVLDVGPFGKALPLICYESAFPHTVLKASKASDTNMIINLTNDGWFDGTTGGAQHLAIAKVRSAETGLPQLRVANTGITALIDGYGIVKKRTKSRQMSQIEHTIPKHIEPNFLKNLY